MTSGRTVAPADRLADAVREASTMPMPIEARALLVDALAHYSSSTDYLDRLGCRQRRRRAKLAAA